MNIYNLTIIYIYIYICERNYFRWYASCKSNYNLYKSIQNEFYHRKTSSIIV